MNKYQKAYERLSKRTFKHYKTFDEVFDDIDTLGELVEKETPAVPSYEGDGYDENGNMIYDTWFCPNCDERYEVEYQKYKYCPECGQRIDWSEEE